MEKPGLVHHVGVRGCALVRVEHGGGEAIAVRIFTQQEG